RTTFARNGGAATAHTGGDPGQPEPSALVGAIRAVIPDTTSGPSHAPAPPPRAQREEFFIGDTVGFTDKHLSERVGIVRLNAKTASIAVNDSEGHWRVSHALLRKIVDI
ncbi:hypothetical protein PQR34_48845, partial [Paraburkholderia sediminicola]